MASSAVRESRSDGGPGVKLEADCSFAGGRRFLPAGLGLRREVAPDVAPPKNAERCDWGTDGKCLIDSAPPAGARKLVQGIVA
jgi:hypothetical protein